MSAHVRASGAAVIDPNCASHSDMTPRHHRPASRLPRQIFCTVVAAWSLRRCVARSPFSRSRRARSSSLVSPTVLLFPA